MAGKYPRIYGRINVGTVSDPVLKWVEVDQAPDGDTGYVYLTNLIQVLKLNLGESPFWGNWGIPAHQSVETQIAPDFYVNFTQQNFAQRFAALTVAKTDDNPPTYQINSTFFNGTAPQATVAT